MPLEPGVITHIAAMASRFGHKQWNTKQPEQKTQTTNTASEHPIPQPTPAAPAQVFFFFFVGVWGGEERAADEGPQRDKC